MGRKPKCRKFRTNRSGQQSFCISTVPGGQMQEGTTPGQGLFLQSYCISSIHGGQKEDDCRDAGGRVTQGAVAEVELRQEQKPRAMQATGKARLVSNNPVHFHHPWRSDVGRYDSRARIVPTILLHFHPPWRSEGGRLQGCRR